MSHRHGRVGLIALIVVIATATVPAAGRETRIGSERGIPFNEGWRFVKGEAAGAEAPAFADSAWRALDLPHDWAIEGPSDPKYNPHSGGLPYLGVGWYRKCITLSERAQGRRISIEFDGAMSNSRVWLNGNELGGRPCGYIGFPFYLTPHLRFGATENVLAVRLSPEDQSSRWYPGAGIYRNVWLDVTWPVRAARWGTFVTTPQVSDDSATVSVQTGVENAGARDANVALETTIVDASGRRVARAVSNFPLPAGAE